MRFLIEEGGNEGALVSVEALGGGRYRVQYGEKSSEIVEAYESAEGLFLRRGDGHGFSVSLAGPAHAPEGTCGAWREQLSVLRPSIARQRAKGSKLSGGDRRICSPMPGRVVQVLVSKGETVHAGQGVVIVEAIKMENELRAVRDGAAESVLCAAGDLVEGGAELVRLSAE